MLPASFCQMERIPFGLLLLLTCLSASAEVYYVNSGSGNDANSGELPATAWKTLTTSVSKLSAGDVLNCTGSWSISSQFTCSTANITLQGGGAATLDIRPVSSSGTLIFNGSGTVLRGFIILSSAAPTSPVQALLTFRGNNSTMADCTIRDFAAQSVDDEIIVLLTANSCTFSNLFFCNIKDRDVFRAWGVYNKWTSCVFSNCTNPSVGQGGDPHADIFQTWWTGAAVWSNVIERCYFVNSSQATFQLKGTPDNINCNPGREGYWTIRNCIFKDCRTWPVISTDQFRFYNNLLYNCGQGNYPLFLLSDPCNTGGRYYNNVLINTYSETGSSPSCGYNAFSVAAASWGGVGDFVTTEAACKFVNPAAGNFRLQAGSSLIGKGINLSGDSSMTSIDADGTARPSSGAWDIGPFQYRAGSATNQPPIVNAGVDANLFLPTNTVTLSGSATDPEGNALTLSWSCVAGPGVVFFASPTSAVTSATFPTNLGTYVMRLSASDGTNSAAAEVRVTMNPATPPVVASIEAEGGSISSPFTVVGGAIFHSVEGDPSTGGRAVYQFTVPANGSYAISATVNAPDASADSFYVNIDGEPADPYMIWDVLPLTSGFETRWISWRGNGTSAANDFSPKVFTLSAGQHSLIIIGREANAALDRLEVRAMGVAPCPPSNPLLLNGILSWNAAIGVAYRVDYKTNLSQANWEVRGIVTATNTTARFSDIPVLWPRCFFRVVSL